MDALDYGSPKPDLGRSPATGYSDPSSSDADTAVGYAHKEHRHKQRSPDPDNDGHTLNPVDTYQTYEEHGAPIDNSGQNEAARRDYEHHKHLWWYRVRYTCRDAFAEFCGTMIMIVFGDGSVAQVTLSANPNLPQASQNKGEYQSISWGWGIGVMLGVYVCGCSGGHLNPAITMVNCLYRGFPWWKWPIYACAQVFGCFCGAAIIYGNYKSAIDAYEGYGVRTVPGYSDTATAGVFNTYPQPFLTKTGQVFSEIISSAVLVFVIFALKDERNLGAGNLMPLMLFFLIFGIGATLGWETGYAINLARDFGPRLFTYMVGYGPEVWRAGDYYFWVPMICPFIGAAFGGFLYDLLIYTGKSPINTEWLGIKSMVHPSKHGIKKAIKEGDVERAV
ncbi:glycerol channel [Lithohypha guttulata]|uniref:Glycerol channel n=1 Tax=Lithohypha guttulata TaxID=1690604 RepID=A0AAN7YDD6_9EURO|nr:glycerol channel [Lithohypha guttulata]